MDDACRARISRAAARSSPRPRRSSEIYTSGRGSLKVRARWKIEDLARGQWQLVVTELPPGTSAQKVLEEIDELTNPKVKAGKKSLTPEQQQTEALMLSVLDTVRDESGKDARCAWCSSRASRRSDRDEFMPTSCSRRPAWRRARRSTW